MTCERSTQRHTGRKCSSSLGPQQGKTLNFLTSHSCLQPASAQCHCGLVYKAHFDNHREPREGRWRMERGRYRENRQIFCPSDWQTFSVKGDRGHSLGFVGPYGFCSLFNSIVQTQLQTIHEQKGTAVFQKKT